MISIQTTRDIFIIIFVTILGIICGFADNSIIYNIADIISQMLLNMFKFISIPILFLAIMSTICSVANIADYKIISQKTLKYSIFTTLVSAFTALAIFIIVNPNIDIENTAIYSDPNKSKFTQYIIDMVPSNMVELFLSGNVISVVLFAFICGFASLRLDNKHRNFLQDFFSSLFHLMMQIAQLIIKLVPLIIWSSITLIIRDYVNGYNLSGLIKYIVAITTANVIQAVIILPLMLLMKSINPIALFRNTISAIITAFFTKSSMAALPDAIRCAIDNAKIDSKIVKFTMPLCITINMNACAAFITLTVLTIASSYGVEFTYFELVLWTIIASIAAFGNAGVPMGCYFMASAFLTSLDIPLYYMGIILPFYLILDMLETAVNVWSNICITSIIGRNKKLIP